MKEAIKNIIKRTKTNEKVAQMDPMGADTPPGLSYSLPTSATYSVATPHTRVPSIGDPFSPGHKFSHTNTYDHFDVCGNITSSPHAVDSQYPAFVPTPYEVDIKTETETFVDDRPTRKDSSTSTFSTLHPPPGFPPYAPEDEWIHDDIFESRDMFAIEDDPEFEFYPPALAHNSQTLQIAVPEEDRFLLDYFIDHVLKLIFPILEVNQRGLAKSELIFPALANNKIYLHCCLSIAAVHLKSIQKREDAQIEQQIINHRFASINELCTSLSDNIDDQRTLEATLALIVFPCSVGGECDSIADIAWHQHFDACTRLTRRLELPYLIEQANSNRPRPPLNMSLVTWIDILGATMMGRSPQFADTYRDKNSNGSHSGLCEMMGCDDQVMYMISEIACLDALKTVGSVDNLTICQLVISLAQHLDTTEPPPHQLEYAVATNGCVKPMCLTDNITCVFRLAARIYLSSLVPGFSTYDDSMTNLVTRLAGLLVSIPSGPDGFDRSVVWPLLIGGSMSTPKSEFRRVLEERIVLLGDQAELGSFGRMVRLLREVWNQSDFVNEAGERQDVHWRDVMKQRGWDYLLI